MALETQTGALDWVGWGGRQEGGPRGKGNMYTQLTHFTVLQKLTQHCKATIPIKKKKEFQFMKMQELIRKDSDAGKD